MRLLPLLAALLLPAAARAQQEGEVVPVTGFTASETATSCMTDICGTVPMPMSNAMLMPTGQWMLTVSAQRQQYIGSSDGSNSTGSNEIINQGFTMAPQRMTMDMTMVQAMYGLNEDNTFMAMLPYVSNSMKMVMDDGTHFTMNSSGVGDVQLGLANRTWQGSSSRVVVFGGVSLPTGSVNEKDDLPGFPNQTVDYVMQPGSGTVDLRPAVTWLHDTTEWVFGSQFALIQRLGMNSQGWNASNEQEVSVWAAQKLDMYSSITGRLTAKWWGDYHGHDGALDPTMSPTQDPKRQAGQRVDMALGYRDHGFVAEAGIPIYEYLDGPQLSLNWFASIGWEFTF
jgi:hypothetical protein